MKKINHQKYEINTISSLHKKDDIFSYIESAIEMGNKIYKNEKSDSFLNWEPFSTGTIFESGTTSKDNISQPNTDVKIDSDKQEKSDTFITSYTHAVL